jgi:hypothetical protein
MAFYSCNRLEDIIIPDNIRSIGGGAFLDCRTLKFARLGSGLTTIEATAFAECRSLESIVSLSVVPPTIQTSTFDNVPSTAKVYVRCNSKPAYEVAWNIFTDFVGMSDTTYRTASICEGTTYSDENFQNVSGGTYYRSFPSINDCDSVITLTITEIIFELTPTPTVTQNGSTFEITWQGTTSPATSYEVYRNGTLIATTTEPSYTDNDEDLTIDATYCYHIQQIDGICRSGFSDTICRVFTTSGITIDDLRFTNCGLRVYPNPTNDILTICRGEKHVLNNEKYLAHDEICELFDITGKCVGAYPCGRPDNNGNAVIDISHLQNGMYYLRVGSEVVKVVKN